jgi:exopolysaccharide biosynthesis polyprenyl glycosylphosphotransferase
MDGSSESTLVVHSSDARAHVSEGGRRSRVQKILANSTAAAQTSVLILSLLAAVRLISMTHYANGVLAICGFGIAALYWGTAWKAEEVDNVVWEIVRRGLRVAALISLATVASTLVVDADSYPVDSTRNLFILFAIASAGIVVLTIADRLSYRGTTQCVMVFGDGKTALELSQQVKREMPWTKVCVLPLTSLPSVPANSAPDAPACVHPTIVELAPDVALVSAVTWEAAPATLTSHLAPFAIDVLLVDAWRSRWMQGAVVNFAGLSCLRVFPKPLASHQRAIKRAFDIAVSAVLIILLLPLFCLIALIIKLDSPGPILFRQPRVGQYGTHFTIWKFRTMVTQAADLFAKTPTVLRDPRLTRFGALLRKTSLDELPQLFNVLFGSMSLVGPRPHAMNGNQFGSVVANYAARHRVKPGITGLAQVSGWRGPADTLTKIEQRIANDLRYIRQWSIRQDVLIMCRTLFALSGRNAF